MKRLLVTILVACAPAAAATPAPNVVAVSAVDGGGLIAESADAAPEPSAEQRVLDSITVQSSRERTITRAGLELLLQHQNELMGMIETTPEGKGIRLFGIRRESVVAKLGLENGDRLEAVNGESIEAPGRAVDVYQHLREATDLDVLLVRRGALRELIIHVR